MSMIAVTGSSINGSLQQLLMVDEIVPGSDASYQICKTIYSYHPLGRKMVDSPVMVAQSQRRAISIANAPENRVREAFEAEWQRINADAYIAQVAGVARIYGVGTLVLGAMGIDPDKEIPAEKMADLPLYFNVLDPLNTAGSLVLNQDPNAPDFQKHTVVTSAGVPYHRSRTIVLMNERPLYIEYTTSAFGYVGRSVYQRALYPLKSFIQTMVTDDMISRKAGLIVAKLKAPGSIIDNAMQRLAGVKRQLLKEAETNNVLSIDTSEDIESLNLENIEGAGTFARTNILKNIATAADMPAKMLENETMVQGFGEGTEDAKNLARFIDGIREWMNPLYQFFDEIVMRRAWNEDFFRIIQQDYPEYEGMNYTDAFYRWKNSFKVEWPSLLRDPDSETKAEEVRQKALIAMMEVLLPHMDPDNRVRVIEWAIDNAGENRILFPQPLVLDSEALRDYEPPVETMGDAPTPPRPFSSAV
jgi:hypothetical protein